MVGERKLSNGVKLTVVDWRANRLVDALAKMAAKPYAAPPATVKALESGAAAVRNAVALLG
eukprot:10658973-Karenia_brevis.AAC.1